MTSSDPMNGEFDTPYSAVDVATAMLFGGRSVLQIGHHPGLETQVTMLGCELVSIVTDVESYDVLMSSGTEAHLVENEVTSMLEPIVGRQFDQMVVIHHLNQVPDPVGLVRALAKHLTPDGQVVVGLRNSAHVDVALSVLLGRAPQLTTRDQPVRLFDRTSIESLLESAGLAVIDVVDLHRRADLGALATCLAEQVGNPPEEESISAEVLAALTRMASTVFEWVVVAAPSPRERTQWLTRRLLGESIERARLLAQSDSHAQLRDEQVKALESGHQREIDRLRTQMSSLSDALDDALRLEKEVDWQRKFISAIGTRNKASEIHLENIEKDHAHAVARATQFQDELAATRRRVGFIVMDRIAQRVVRSRILTLLIVAPLRKFIGAR